MTPKDQTDLCHLSATDALAMFNARTLSPVELLQAQIQRTEHTEDTINAFSQTFFDAAMDAARASEKRYAKGAPVGALDGLTLAAKAENSIKGLPGEYGSLVHKGKISIQTDTIIERCLIENAIIHAQTTTPEFSCVGVCHSKLWGVTRNPWNPDFSPGGSSGGSGASLAIGSASLATGSDIAGSIRIPASACGVVGFKPPYGRVPQSTPFNYDSFCHNGPMARSIADCILLQNVLAGPSSRDITSLKPKLTLPAQPSPVKGMSIAYSPDLGYFDIDPEVRRNTENALDILRDAGAEVHEVALGWTEDTLTAAMDYLGHFFGNSIAQFLDTHPDDITGYARAFAEFSRKTTAKANFRALSLAGEMYERLAEIHRTHDALICPTLAVPSVPADFDWTIDPRINDILSSTDPMMVSWCLTYPFNMLSRCPVLQVPSGRAANGVPTGVQIIGRTYEDADVFRIGAAIEQAQNWYATSDMRPDPSSWTKTGDSE
ncbi:amidase [Roseovarius aestuarii]|nr:amidase [Roseovarius aestuarii]